MSKDKPRPKNTPTKNRSKNCCNNGKGDSPRNIFSKKFKSNYDKINWKKK